MNAVIRGPKRVIIPKNETRMGAIPRRMPSANHKDEAIHESYHSKYSVSANHEDEAVHKAFHSEHSTSFNHIAEEETQSENSFAIQEEEPTSKPTSKAGMREAQRESGLHH